MLVSLTVDLREVWPDSIPAVLSFEQRGTMAGRPGTTESRRSPPGLRATPWRYSALPTLPACPSTPHTSLKPTAILIICSSTGSLRLWYANKLRISYLGSVLALQHPVPHKSTFWTCPRITKFRECAENFMGETPNALKAHRIGTCVASFVGRERPFAVLTVGSSRRNRLSAPSAPTAHLGKVGDAESYDLSFHALQSTPSGC